MDSDGHIDGKDSDLLRQNWLTDDLIDETEFCYQYRSEIGAVTRNEEGFKTKGESLVIKCREFTSYKQLCQAVYLFQEV